jgi:hypothetical protein
LLIKNKSTYFMIKCGICLNINTIQLSQFLIDKRTAPNVNQNLSIFSRKINLPMRFFQSNCSLNIHWWKINKKKKRKKWTELFSPSFFSLVSLIILHFVVEKNATPAEKSTSYIHHHHCRRHFCPVECVNFKRRNKKKLSSSFFSLT